jgi:hypothetical protein
MKLLILLSLLVSLSSCATKSSMSFESHTGAADSWDNALALNVEYDSIIKLRKKIEVETGQSLKFFTGWSAQGEAHVTTISPPEYKFVLRHHITMKRINEIALASNIQSADLVRLGIGSGKTKIEGKMEETFFVIVDSIKLREIRIKIHQEFVANGGKPSAFDPTWFFPHMTIGYTKKDIHENSGLLKDLKHSYDNRFKLD